MCPANILQEESCCQEGDILCLSIPSPVTLSLLGASLEVQLPCFRIAGDLDLGIVGDLLQILVQLLQAILDIIGGLTGSFATKNK